MECQHCQKDYEDDTILVQYDGLYNYEEMIEFVKKSYFDILGEVIAHNLPTEYLGFKNMGSVLIR